MIRDFHNININTIDNVVLVLRDKVVRVFLNRILQKTIFAFLIQDGGRKQLNDCCSK